MITKKSTNYIYVIMLAIVLLSCKKPSNVSPDEPDANGTIKAVEHGTKKGVAEKRLIGVQSGDLSIPDGGSIIKK